MICWLLTAYMLVVFVHVIFSWVPQPPEPLIPVREVARRLVEPVVAPIRRVLPPVQLGTVGVDVSIIVLFFVLIILQSLFC